MALLRIIKHRKMYDKVSGFIPVSAIDKRTKAIVNDVGKYFSMNPSEEKVNFASFRSLFFTSWHKGLKDEDCDYYNTVLDRMTEEVPEEVANNIINTLLELEFATEMGNLLNDFREGEEIELVHTVANKLKKIQDTMECSVNVEYADFEESTEDEDLGAGLQWPLESMNKIYWPMKGGDQTIIAARPGQGKTSFLTFTCFRSIQTMPKEKVIVWFNNEGSKKRIMSRQVMSALNIDTVEMQRLKKKGVLKQNYIEVMGSLDRVRVYDIHGKHHWQLEQILEAVGEDRIGLIIFDMLDNVKYAMPSSAREDQRLEELYKWSREMGVKYDCPILPTSQVSMDGEGLMYPTKEMLKDSKTGKQGACDNILMIGHSNDPLLARKRGISMPKTKTRRPGQHDILQEIVFDEDKGRFYD